jgi:hypothetical protein
MLADTNQNIEGRISNRKDGSLQAHFLRKVNLLVGGCLGAQAQLFYFWAKMPGLRSKGSQIFDTFFYVLIYIDIFLMFWRWVNFWIRVGQNTDWGCWWVGR